MWRLLSKGCFKISIQIAICLVPIFATLPALADDHKEILFGATMTLTGSNAPFAQQCLNGATLAVEEVNSSGGVLGKPLKLAVEDFGELDLKRAAAAAHFLLGKDNLVAMLPIWHEDTEVVAPIAEQAGRVTMTLGAGGPRVTRFSPSTFRATMSDSKLAAMIVEDELKRGAKTACIISADSSYYVDVVKDISAAWTTGGGRVVFNETLPYIPSETRSLVTKLRHQQCDTIFAWASPAGLAPLIRELRTQKVSGTRALPWFAATEDVLHSTKGDSAKFKLYRYQITGQEFISRYSARYKQAPLRPAGNCYDGVKLLAGTINSVGTDRDSIRRALLSHKAYQGVTGPFIIAPDRERDGESIEKMQVVEGQLLPLPKE